MSNAEFARMKLRMTAAFMVAWLLLSATVLSWPIYAHATPTTSDQAQDKSQTAENVAQDKKIDASAEAVQRNTEALAILNAKNAFWLQVMGAVMPLLTAIGVAVVGYLQVKAARERAMLAISIDGLKTDLVNAKYAAGYFEGKAMEADKHAHPELGEKIVQRSLEIADSARGSADGGMGDAAARAVAKPAKSDGPRQADGTLEAKQAVIDVLKPGESASVKVMASGTAITKDPTKRGK